jgi:flagellar hook-associated protein 3 FlgL
VRITNSLITQGAISAMLSSQRGIESASRQVSTGIRVDRVSADPTAGSQIMLASNQMRALTQYKRNVDSATAKSDAQEAVLNSVSDLLTRARELGVSQSSDTANSTTRTAVKQEVDQLLRQAAASANTKHDGAYLFGGSQSDSAPAAMVEGPVLGYTLATVTGPASVELSPGQSVTPADTATTIFGDATAGVLAALRDLSAGLAANDKDAISNATTTVNDAFNSIQDRLGATGARANQLQVTKANLNSLEVTLTSYKSSLSEVDMEKAMTELVSKQTTYQAAMMATSKLINLNLTSYLG